MELPAFRRRRLGLQRCDPRDQPEENGKGFAPRQPRFLAEQGHADPGHDAVEDDRRRQDGRIVRRGIDQLEPGEGQEADDRRPIAEPIGQRRSAQSEHSKRADPGIEIAPEIAEERVSQRHADPPHRPHGQRQRIGERIAAAEIAGEDQQREHAERNNADPAFRRRRYLPQRQARIEPPPQSIRRRRQQDQERRRHRQRAAQQVIAGRQQQDERTLRGVGEGGRCGSRQKSAGNDNLPPPNWGRVGVGEASEVSIQRRRGFPLPSPPPVRGREWFQHDQSSVDQRPPETLNNVPVT